MKSTDISLNRQASSASDESTDISLDRQASSASDYRR